MSRPSKAEHERIVAAMRAHAVAGGDLTASGYATAAGIAERTARDTVRKLGLPLLHRDPPGTRTPPATPPDASDPDATEDTPASPASSKEADEPVTKGEVGKLIQAHVRAATQPGPSADLTVKDPTKAAVLKASSAVAQQHVSSVVTQAERWQTWDEEAGEIVRRLFYDTGLRQHFEGPGVMVQTLAEFWWENRDLVPALQEQLESAVARIDELTRQLDPEVQRRQAIDQVWAMALTAAVAGHPLSREDFAYFIQVAEATALHAPIPAPLPPASPVRFGR